MHIAFVNVYYFYLIINIVLQWRKECDFTLLRVVCKDITHTYVYDFVYDTKRIHISVNDDVRYYDFSVLYYYVLYLL